MEICLAKLSDMERHIANGEVLGVSLLLEDITEQENVNNEPDGGKQKNMMHKYELLCDFLRTSIRLEQLRNSWSEITQGITINSSQNLQRFCQLYDSQVVSVVVSEIKSLPANDVGRFLTSCALILI